MPKRRSADRRTTSLIATLITLVVAALVWAAQSFLAAPAPVAPLPVAEPAWHQLYFTDPDRTAGLREPAGGLPDAVVATFNAAQQTIDLAVYEIDLPVYADALIAARQRGVRVRLVTDSDYLDEAPLQTLRLAGVPVVDDRRDAFMHHKFAVIDGALVWTGSMNFTFNDAYRNNNNMLLVRSARLAENFTAQFEALFEDQQFNRAITAPRPALNLSGTLVETYFSPQGGVAAHVLDVLRAAQTSVHFMAFAFTRSDFSEVLIEKARAGVTVQGVFERRQVEAGADGAWEALRRAGLDVRQDGNPYVLHHKVIIVDRQIVVTGSYNFSRNAEDANNENVLIIHDAEIAGQYLKEWERVWERAGNPNSQ